MHASTCDAVDLTQRLIRFDTINPPGQERRCAEFLASMLEDAGFTVDLREFSADRVNLVATSGSAAGGAPLVFTGHIDVVPLGLAPWTHEPFGAERIDGRIYGRGASDMKSGVAAFVCAALATARDATPPNIALVITAGEETGCTGASALVAQRGVPSAAALVVGEPTANTLCAGHKGALWLQVVSRGKTAHGSMPERGDNAIYKAARAVQKLQAFQFSTPNHPTLGRPTLTVNTIRGGLNINSIPDRTEIGVDIRTTPDVDHAALQEELQALIGEDAILDSFLDLRGIWTSPDLDWMRRASRITSEITGEPSRPAAATFFSDACVLAPAMGDPRTIILGPGEPSQAHQTDEWCEVRRIEQAVTIYTALMRDWARDPR